MSFFISFLAGVVFFYSFHYFPFVSSFIVFMSLIIFILKKRWLLIPVIAVGILYAFLRYTPEPDISTIAGKEIIAIGKFDSDAVDTASGRLMQTFRVGSAYFKGPGEQLNRMDGIGLNIITDKELEIGSEYEMLIKTGRDMTRFNPGSIKNDNIYANLIEVRDFKKGKQSLWRAFQIARAELNRYIEKNFTIDSGSLIAAITTGRRSNMSEELRTAFNSTGLAHILSISGTHFGIFSVFLFGIFRFLMKYLPYRILQRITLYISPSQGAAVLCLPFMIVYLALSGWSIPAIRAFIMISLFLSGLLIGRKGFWLNSLLFAAFVIVLWSPDALFSLSFQLSFLAVLFIGLTIGYGEEHKKDNNRVLRIIRNTLFISLAASLGTAPLVAYHFHYFSIISPLANLFVTPLIGFVLMPLALISSFIFLFTGHFVFETAVKAVSEIVINIVMYMSHFPFADIKIPAFPAIAAIFFYAGIAFYFIFERKKYILIVLSTLIVIYISFCSVWRKSDISATYLDVGQGDASVVELPDRRLIVIDTGSNGREVAAFLKYGGRKTIDALVLSHPHPDHTGGTDYLMRHFNVKGLWDNGRLIYPEGMVKGINHRVLERGDIIEGKGYKIYALHPYKEFYTMNGDEYNEGNNSSLVLKIEGKNKSFLFSGDIEEEAEDDIMHLDKWLDSDVVKVPHHGGKTSASRMFFNAVSPEIAVISAGRDNAFGHPHIEMIEMLGNSKVFRTDIDGAVKIMEKDDKLEIKTFKDFQFEKAKNLRGEIENIKKMFMVW